ncbi:MAG: type II secretion system protein M [Gammaproteobacteria bacterium]|nr:type II secretion system protein M [Gammaproteobacteria bacterium]
MMQRWYALSQRERVVLLTGALILGVALLYLLVWQPWHQKLESLRAQVPAKQQTLDWMQAEAEAIKPLLASRGQNRGDDDIPLLTIIEQSAEANKIKQFIRRIQPDEENRVKVWLTEAQFDPWLTWIDELKQQGIEVVSTTINRGQQNKVTIRVTLQRAT